MVGEQEQYSCEPYVIAQKRGKIDHVIRALDSCGKFFSFVARPLSAYRKRTRIETHFSSITLQRDDRSRLNLIEEGWIFMFENWTMAMLRIHIHKPQ